MRAAPGRSPICLSVQYPSAELLCTGRVTLVLSDEPVQLELTVPAGPASLEQLLPIVRGLSDMLVERASAKAATLGKAVSCGPACGACCRQLVPISAAEGRALAHLVARMPEPHQSGVRRRFEDALRAATAAGIIDRVENGLADREVGLDYFRLGLACPFLVGESCSIYMDRPTSCREYLVTSPASACATLVPGTIDTLALEGEPSLALLKSDPVKGWMPLITALAFVNLDVPPDRESSGPELVRRLVQALAPSLDGVGEGESIRGHTL